MFLIIVIVLFVDLDSGSVLLQHEMPMISFASGGDSDSLDYIAYVAKDSSGGRLGFHSILFYSQLELLHALN